MLFDITDIAAQMPAESLAKARASRADWEVDSLNIQQAGTIITAIVRTAEDRAFRVYIRVAKAKSAVKFDAECGCPLGRDCEHVVAVLSRAVNGRSPAVVEDTSGARAVTSRGSRSKQNGQQLIYTLFVEDEEVELALEVARRSPDGELLDSHSLEIERLNRRVPPRFLDKLDIALLADLETLPRDVYAGLYSLNTPQSGQLLARMLETHRCCFYHEDKPIPLRLGNKRCVSLAWSVDEYAAQHPVVVIEPSAKLLPTVFGLWYLDQERGECGPLEGEVSSEVINEFICFPEVRPGKVAEFVQQWRTVFPDVGYPPIEELEFEPLPRREAVPLLRFDTLWDDEAHELDEDFADLLCLSFIYDIAELDLSVTMGRFEPATRFIEGRLIQLPRDKATERAAVRELEKRGLVKNTEWRDDEEDCFSFVLDLWEDAASAWLNFQMRDLPKLKTLGWKIDFKDFQHRLVEASDWRVDVAKLSKQDWFDVALSVKIDGREVNLLPILLEAIARFPGGLPDANEVRDEHILIPIALDAEGELSDDDEADEQRILSLPAARFLPLLETLLEMYQAGDALEAQKLRLNRVQLATLSALEYDDAGPGFHWLGDEDATDLARRLRDMETIPEVKAPKELSATLRPYQQHGLNWLQFLRAYRLAGVLADDMGLGKTVQTLAHVLLEKHTARADRPSLVVAPTSLMFNWRSETQRFAPGLKLLVLHGTERKARFKDIAKHDLVLTTYPLLSRDKTHLLAHDYHLLILDEAQTIKNPKAQASRVVRDIKARHRLCLTGTPMENHLGELWSLFDFLLPGLLGNRHQFQRIFRAPIEKLGCEASAERLSRRVRPFLLRRTKQQVASELPPKTEIIQSVELEGKQRELYETVRLAMHRKVREEIERQDLGRGHIMVLDALLKLRQVCCDPRLLEQDAPQAAGSAKLDLLMEILPEMVEEGRRILIFSQFTTMLGLIEEELRKLKLDYVKLTGRTRDREAPVRRFQDGEVAVFLISLKAGGVGLNLTGADVVIHYDPWWNPAAERQATDRAHRIGQTQAVLVYKLICEGTLEEKIHVMQERKQALADGLYQAGGGNQPQWSEEDIDMLFAPLEN